MEARESRVQGHRWLQRLGFKKLNMRETMFQKTKGIKSERETDQLTNLNSYVSVKDTKQNNSGQKEQR